MRLLDADRKRENQNTCLTLKVNLTKRTYFKREIHMQIKRIQLNNK